MKITGKDLIQKGFTPDKWFGEALSHINKKGMSLEQAVKHAKKVLDAQPKHVKMKKTATKYHVNLDAQTEYEKSNKESVNKAMEHQMKLPYTLKGAVMPDACPTGTYSIPVGGVLVTDNVIYPASHSADICCSMYLTEVQGDTAKKILDTLHKNTHFGPGGRQKDNRFMLTEEMKNKIEKHPLLKGQEKAISRAFTNMGTQGDGNHFAYVGKRKSSQNVTIVTHHGSRGFGAEVYKIGMRLAEKFKRKLAPSLSKKDSFIPMNTKEGEQYWDLLQLVRSWTKLNHQLIHDSVVNELGVKIVDRFWNEHNFVFKNGNQYIHAKGATPLLDKFVPDSVGQLRIIPLNMSEPILLVEGKETKNNLGFAPHGAGRNISRSQHKRNKGGKTVLEILKDETQGIDVRFYSGTPDISELPSAYKNADELQRQIEHYKIANVVDKIFPYGCIMAGEIDNYKKFK